MKPSHRSIASLVLLFCLSPVFSQAQPAPPPEQPGRPRNPRTGTTVDSTTALPETRERQKAKLDAIIQSFRAGEFQLDNGHMWLDGHVYPFMFLTPAEVRLIEAFGTMRHRVLHEVKAVRFNPEWKDGMQAPNYDDSAWKQVPVGLGSGRQFSEEVYRFTLPPAPDATPGRERFFALRPLHPSKEAWPETTIYVNGKATGALVRWHDYWELSSLMDPTRENQVTLKAFSIYNDPPRGYRQIAIVERDPVYDRLYWNLRVLAEAASIIPETEPVHAEIKKLIRGVLDGVDPVQLATPFGHAQAELADRQLEEGRLALARTAATLKAPAADFTVAMIYHAHHDTAWQWTVAHSRGKTERAVLNNLYLMDRYPDYRYLYTAPLHYQTLKEDRPDLFARVKSKVASGQWIANGATWIEPDVRLPSGESLVRQLLYGMDFFERELGIKEHILFLPDTFGHTPAMPQIMRGFEVPTLFAMRVRDVNNPHDVFRWQGIDGSQVLVDAITTPAWEYPYLPELHGGRGGNTAGLVNDRVSYSAPDPGPRRMFGVWETFKQKDVTDRQIMAIGWGDGGGGGTEDHVEVAHRSAQLPWLPKLEVTDPVALSKHLHKSWDRYPVYADDIYVGFQRTFTRANRIKQENRAAEELLHDTEFLGAWAARLGTVYDAPAVKRGWQTMLVNHMHDIITGQSIPEVNAEAIASYDKFRGFVLPVQARGLAAITSRITTPAPALILLNSLGFARGGVQEIPLAAGFGATDAQDRPLAVQRLDERRALVALAEGVPAYGYTTLTPTRSPAPAPSATGLSITDRTVENRYLRVTLDEHGQISSLYDKEAGREIVPAGGVLNQLLAVRSSGGFGPVAASPAGERNETITALESLRVVERGPLRATWEIRRRHGESTIVQRLELRHDSRRLDVVNDIDWKEATELQVDFPLALHTTTALQGIQFGHQRVTTTRNNPSDAARSQVAAHEWVDIAEGDYGFALLNDGRYGHDVKSGGIRLTLFTNGQAASASGDVGSGRFTYSLYPHTGNLTEGRVVQAARDLNHPISVSAMPAQPAGSLPRQQGLVTISPDSSVFLDTLKPAEDGDGWILRFYESGGRTTSVTVALGLPVKSVTAVNLREAGDQTVPLAAGEFSLAFSPFQIRTVRVR